MKIRERQLAYAFALAENAKNTLYTATQVIGNTLRYGKDGDIRDEILGAAKTLENARRKMEEVMDANTDWSDNKRVPFVVSEGQQRLLVKSYHEVFMFYVIDWNTGVAYFEVKRHDEVCQHQSAVGANEAFRLLCDMERSDK